MKKKKPGSLREKAVKAIGPGFVTGCSDDDPSGITTYTQAGAKYGLSFLWTALLTYPLMYALQEMSARIGIVTKSGLTLVIKKNYSKATLIIIISLLIPTIILNIAADLAAMGALFKLIMPSIPVVLFLTLLTIMLGVFIVFLGYQKIERVLKYLGLTLLCYFIVPFLVKQDYSKMFYSTFVPDFKWDRDYLEMLVAILGTTISPYLFFWQSYMSVEHSKGKQETNKNKIYFSKIDVNAGMIMSNLAMYFILLTAGSVLFENGLREIKTIEDASKALEPLAGDYAFILFSSGVFGVGLLTIPILGACVGFIMADMFNWKKGLNKTFTEAKEFYLIILGSILLGLLINFADIDPIKTLIFTSVCYGIIAPILILLIIQICNNKKIMNKETNKTILNFLGTIAFVIMGAAGLFYLIALFI